MSFPDSYLGNQPLCRTQLYSFLVLNVLQTPGIKPRSPHSRHAWDILFYIKQRSPYLFSFYILFVKNYDLGRQGKACRSKTVRWTLHNFLYPIDWWSESSHFFNLISRFSIMENIVKTSYKEYVNNDLLVWTLGAESMMKRFNRSSKDSNTFHVDIVFNILVRRSSSLPSV